MNSEVFAVAVRVVAAGVLVSVFALAGELVRPKRFAGIFSAAPSVALASLVVLLVTEGAGRVRLELEGMILGAVAFVGCTVLGAVAIRRVGALKASLIEVGTWLAVAGGGYLVVLR